MNERKKRVGGRDRENENGINSEISSLEFSFQLPPFFPFKPDELWCHFCHIEFKLRKMKEEKLKFNFLFLIKIITEQSLSVMAEKEREQAEGGKSIWAWWLTHNINSVNFPDLQALIYHRECKPQNTTKERKLKTERKNEDKRE